jgi:hypothetical protein
MWPITSQWRDVLKPPVRENECNLMSATAEVCPCRPRPTAHGPRNGESAARSRGCGPTLAPEYEHKVIGGHWLTRDELEANGVGLLRDRRRAANAPQGILRAQPLVEGRIRFSRVRAVDHERPIDAQNAVGCKQTRGARKNALGDSVGRDVAHIAAVCVTKGATHEESTGARARTKRRGAL